jgi:hypothetical protein
MYVFVCGGSPRTRATRVRAVRVGYRLRNYLLCALQHLSAADLCLQSFNVADSPWNLIVM